MYCKPGVPDGLSVTRTGSIDLPVSFKTALQNLTADVLGKGTVHMLPGAKGVYYTPADIPSDLNGSEERGLTSVNNLAVDVPILRIQANYNDKVIIDWQQSTTRMIAMKFGKTSTNTGRDMQRVELVNLEVRNARGHGIWSSITLYMTGCTVRDTGVVQADNSGRIVAVNLTANNTTIGNANYNLSNASGSYIEDCLIVNSGKNGMLVDYSDEVTIDYVTVRQSNTLLFPTGDSAAGIKLQRTSGTIVRNCFFDEMKPDNTRGNAKCLWFDIRSGTDTTKRFNGWNYIVQNRMVNTTNVAFLYEISRRCCFVMNHISNAGTATGINQSQYVEFYKNYLSYTTSYGVDIKDARRPRPGEDAALAEHATGATLGNISFCMNVIEPAFTGTMPSSKYLINYNDVDPTVPHTWQGDLIDRMVANAYIVPNGQYRGMHIANIAAFPRVDYTVQAPYTAGGTVNPGHASYLTLQNVAYPNNREAFTIVHEDGTPFNPLELLNRAPGVSMNTYLAASHVGVTLSLMGEGTNHIGIKP